MKNKIIFRADANFEIGYGHFIRTLALADILKDYFFCVFYTANPTKYQISQLNKVCEFVSLNEENKLSEFLSFLSGDEIVILDNYYYDSLYQQKIKAKGCKVVCIDDMHDKRYNCDVIINQVITDKSKFNCRNNTFLCLGNSWALLRKPFLDLKSIERHTIYNKLHVLIMYGGIDKFNLSEETAEYISKISIVDHITIVVGDSHQMKSITSNKIDIKRSLSASEIANLMQISDVGIMSTSSVCLEAKACSLPIIAGYYVDNQKEIYEVYKKNKEIVPIGSLLNKTYLEKIKNAIINKSYYSRHNDCQNNNYVKLFVWLSLKYFKSDTYVFKNYLDLSEEESKIVYNIRISDRIRIYMDNPNVFAYSTHCKFIKSLCYDTSKLYWAIYKGGEFVGAMNISFISFSEIERGIYLNPNFIGKGIAKSLDSELIKVLKNTPIKRMKAKIIIKNKRSFQYHISIGYKLKKQDESHYYLEFEL